MNEITREIRKATGLTMTDFCKVYLESDWRTFRARLKKGRMYPNESLLICLLTDRSPVQLYGETAFELFCLKGRKRVNDRIKKIVLQTKNAERLSVILSSPEGNIEQHSIFEVENDNVPYSREREPVERGDFDFVKRLNQKST